MASLFNTLTTKGQYGTTPLQEGLMALGPMLMSAGMGRNAPPSLMTAGINQVMNTRAQNVASQQRQQQNQIAQQKLQMAQQAAARQAAAQKQRDDLMKQLFGTPASPGPATPGINPASNPQMAQREALARLAIMSDDYGKAFDILNPKPAATFQTVQNPYGRGGVGQVNTATGQITGYQGAQTAKAPQNYQMPDGTTRAFVAGDPALKAALAQGAIRAPTPQTSLTVKTGEDIGKAIMTGVVDDLKAGRQSAQSAIQSVNRLNRMASSLNDANIGPGSTLGQAADRFAVALGVAGPDTEARLANTQELIKGLARATLDARGSLRGQGQISDQEQRLLQDAVSGDATELTEAEIRVVMNAAADTAEYQYSQYQDLLNRAGTLEPFQPFMGLYGVDELPVYTPPVLQSGTTPVSGNVPGNAKSQREIDDWLTNNPPPPIYR